MSIASPAHGTRTGVSKMFQGSVPLLIKYAACHCCQEAATFFNSSLVTLSFFPPMIRPPEPCDPYQSKAGAQRPLPWRSRRTAAFDSFPAYK